jgi:hypothetical protein
MSGTSEDMEDNPCARIPNHSVIQKEQSTETLHGMEVEVKAGEIK